MGVQIISSLNQIKSSYSEEEVSSSFYDMTGNSSISGLRCYNQLTFDLSKYNITSETKITYYISCTGIECYYNGSKISLPSTQATDKKMVAGNGSLNLSQTMPTVGLNYTYEKKANKITFTFTVATVSGSGTGSYNGSYTMGNPDSSTRALLISGLTGKVKIAEVKNVPDNKFAVASDNITIDTSSFIVDTDDIELNGNVAATSLQVGNLTVTGVVVIEEI